MSKRFRFLFRDVAPRVENEYKMQGKTLIALLYELDIVAHNVEVQSWQHLGGPRRSYYAAWLSWGAVLKIARYFWPRHNYKRYKAKRNNFLDALWRLRRTETLMLVDQSSKHLELGWGEE